MKINKIFSLFCLTGLLLAPLSFCISALTYQSQQGVNNTAMLYDITANEILPSQNTLEAIGGNKQSSKYSYSFPMETINLHLGDTLALCSTAYCVIDPTDVDNIVTTGSTMDPNNNHQVLLTPTWTDDSAFGQYSFGSPDNLTIPEEDKFKSNFPNNQFANAPGMPLYMMNRTINGAPTLLQRFIPMNYQIPDGKSYQDSYPGAYTGTVVLKAHYEHPDWWFNRNLIPEKTITITIPIQITTYAQGDNSVNFPIGTDTSTTETP